MTDRWDHLIRRGEPLVSSDDPDAWPADVRALVARLEAGDPLALPELLELDRAFLWHDGAEKALAKLWIDPTIDDADARAALDSIARIVRRRRQVGGTGFKLPPPDALAALVAEAEAFLLRHGLMEHRGEPDLEKRILAALEADWARQWPEGYPDAGPMPDANVAAARGLARAARTDKGSPTRSERAWALRWAAEHFRSDVKTIEKHITRGRRDGRITF